MAPPEETPGLLSTPSLSQTLGTALLILWARFNQSSEGLGWDTGWGGSRYRKEDEAFPRVP